MCSAPLRAFLPSPTLPCCHHRALAHFLRLRCRRFEQKGFKLVALKMMQADEALLKEHYKVPLLLRTCTANLHTRLST
jgi:hypothetical protein